MPFPQPPAWGQMSGVLEAAPATDYGGGGRIVWRGRNV
ncbi:hypothetical protein AtDm6_1902 [Acetobacter tropicalis]|uniref:Uncharacterized protein n=1 Tax=Acetobacter tropicalis TaxID=104102 RepID=A0A095B226_9PROT|nr:hypothetical protein AtDm6_1902 [Acetobacter tropicalis]